jgi:hypothetical protein
VTEPVVIVRAVQTAMACLSQWDAWDAEGNYYYLRYCSAHGEVRQYETPDWYQVDEDQLIRTVASFGYGGHPLDGDIDLVTFAREAGIRLAPELMEEGFGDHLRDELILRGVIGPEHLEDGRCD